MREIKIGERTYGVSATALALLFYKQEFKSDLVKDLVKMASDMSIEELNYDALQILQFFWAMNKAHKLPDKQPAFESWIQTIPGLDFGDADMVKGIFEEAMKGFFPTSAAKIGAAKKPVKKR